ncbi:MAG: Crp/Fnr family transcriptional regulator, partial [Woeseiaceae bacterium]|nr:Crp/Fnr family transcriptional regulator [Woeseiaceae bacterium]
TISLMPNNRLLAKLRRKDHDHLLAAGDEVDLCIGDVLWEPHTRIRHVYFPLGGFVSQLVPVESKDNLELALVGNEGMLGIPLVLGVNTSTLQALVQGSGPALRISAASFRRELEQLPGLRQHLNRYICVWQAQLALTAACISFHSLDLRLALWLLMTHDRAGSDTLHLTHKFLAQMLGVRRVGITNAAGVLQKQKLLSYSRGEITILNRAGLEKAACSCYQVSKNTYENVLE